MLDYIVAQTDKYIESKPKDERKSLGQFFTSKDTARFMAGLFSVPQKDFIRVLDPGAGSGILSAAVIEVIDKRYPIVKEVELTCYETNSDVISLLGFFRRYTKLNRLIPQKWCSKQFIASCIINYHLILFFSV